MSELRDVPMTASAVVWKFLHGFASVASASLVLGLLMPIVIDGAMPVWTEGGAPMSPRDWLALFVMMCLMLASNLRSWMCGQPFPA